MYSSHRVRNYIKIIFNVSLTPIFHFYSLIYSYFQPHSLAHTFTLSFFYTIIYFFIYFLHAHFFLSYSYCLFHLINFLHISLSLSPSIILSIYFFFLKLSQLRRSFILSVFHDLASSKVHARMKSYK